MSLHSPEVTAYIPPVSSDVIASEVSIGNDDATCVFDYKGQEPALADSVTQVVGRVTHEIDVVELPRLSGRIFYPGIHRRTELVDRDEALAVQATNIHFFRSLHTSPTDLALATMVEYERCLVVEGVTLLTHSPSY